MKSAARSSGLLVELHRQGPPAPDEEKSLVDRSASGDSAAEQELVLRNIRLVYDLARRYQTPGATFEDLVQEGIIGLVKAARRFDPTRGFRFSTFAHWWIRQGISRFVKGPTRAIRLPEYIQDRIARVIRTREELSRDLGRNPTEAEIGRCMEISGREVADLLTLARDASSLEAPMADAGGLPFSSIVLDERRRSLEDEVDYRSARRTMVAGLQRLKSRQIWILSYRFGLVDGRPRSRPWIGKRLGLSAERVRQLEKAALRCLRGGFHEQEACAA